MSVHFDEPPVYLYKVFFLYNCFLDGWVIDVYNGEVKLKIKKIDLKRSDYIKKNLDFDVDEFIEHNDLY